MSALLAGEYPFAASCSLHRAIPFLGLPFGFPDSHSLKVVQAFLASFPIFGFHII